MVELTGTRPMKDTAAFAKGHDAGFNATDALNPYVTGSAEHHNFEVGRRFGRKLALPTAAEPFFHRLD